MELQLGKDYRNIEDTNKTSNNLSKANRATETINPAKPNRITETKNPAYAPVNYNKSEEGYTVDYSEDLDNVNDISAGDAASNVGISQMNTGNNRTSDSIEDLSNQQKSVGSFLWNRDNSASVQNIGSSLL